MIVGYYDWNESIAYPLDAMVDTDVVGFSLSGLIVGASISLAADVAAAIGTDLYIAEVVRDRANGAMITVANSPVLPGAPVFALDFRVTQGGERFVVIPGVVRGSMVGARAAAYLVLSNNAFINKLVLGVPVTLSTAARFDPAVVRVSDRGNVNKFAVVKSTKRADVAIPYVDHPALPTTPIVLDQLTGAPIDAITLSPSGTQYKLVASGGTTYVAMPSSTVLSSSLQSPQYSAAIRPKIFVGRNVNQNTRGVVGTPIDFKFDDWIANPAVYSVIIAAVVYINGVRTTIGGPDGIPKASLAAGFSHTFATPGTYLVSVAATKTQLVGLERNPVAFLTFSATVVVTAAAVYYESAPVSVPVASPSMAPVGVTDYTITETALMVETHTVSRPLLAPVMVNVALGSEYDAEDAEARAAVPAETLQLVAETTAPVFVAGANLGFGFAAARNTITPGVKAGAHTVAPYIGYAVPAFVSCSGAVRTLFGANADADGNVNIVAGAGVTVIPEPSKHAVTVIIEDPKAAASGKRC